MDGGVFNNYPLGMARKLAAEIDTDHNDYKRRFYFYISPNSKDSTADYNFNADDTNIVSTAKRLAGSVFWQSRFQDWLRTDQINGEIKRLDERAKQLLKIIIHADEPALQAMKQSTTELISVIYGDNLQQYTNDQSRLYDQYQDDLPTDTPLSPTQQSVWINSIAVLESSARLTHKDLMKVYTITAKDHELASEPLVSFMGFLDKNFRHHDYMVGRIKGMNMIRHILESADDDLEDGLHLPLNITPPDPSELEASVNQMNLGNAGMDKIDLQVRRDLYNRLKERSFRYLKLAGMNWIVRVGLYNFYIRGQLKKLLLLS